MNPTYLWHLTGKPCKQHSCTIAKKKFFRSRCYIVTRCTNLVSVHYFLPLAISAKMLINKVASGNWACVNGI